MALSKEEISQQSLSDYLPGECEKEGGGLPALWEKVGEKLAEKA